MSSLESGMFPHARSEDWGMYRRDQGKPAPHPDSLDLGADPDIQATYDVLDDAARAGVDPAYLGGTPLVGVDGVPVEITRKPPTAELPVWDPERAAEERADDRETNSGGYAQR